MIKREWWVYLVLIVPLILLIPGAGGIPYPPGGEYSDFAISHLPNALYLQQSIFHHGTIPLWSDTILSGYPFHADPLSGLLYPPGWLAILFPLPWGLNLTIWLHLYLGAVGMYLLARKTGLQEKTALFSALLFELMPKLFAHYGAGHVTLIYAVCWTPWLFLAENSRANVGGGKIKKMATGIALGAILLADPRWAAPVGIACFAYSLFNLSRNFQFQTSSKKANVIFQWLVSWIGQAGIALGIASILILPMFQYASLSTRALMTAKDMLTFSLPPQRLLGLFYPDWGGAAEFALYAGAACWILALLALRQLKAQPKLWFWLGLILGSLIISLGSALPGSGVIENIPVLDLMRVPARFLFLTGFGLAYLAGWGLQGLAGEERIGPVIKILFPFALVISLLALGIALLAPKSAGSFLWSAGVVWLAMLFAAGTIYFRIRFPWIIYFVALITLLDVAWSDGHALEFRPYPQITTDQKAMLDFLKSDNSIYRVYSPSYSLPQEIGAANGIQQADGVDPLQIRSYAAFMSVAGGYPLAGYSVTLPAYLSGDPKTDLISAIPSHQQLGLLNIKYVLSEFDVAGSGLNFIQKFGTTRVYEVDGAYPRVWLVEDLTEAVIPIPDKDFQDQINTVTLATSGPGKLVLSEINYPGWQVAVDGLPSRIQPFAGILRSVDLPVGQHKIVFSYRPVLFLIGSAISALTFLGIALFALLGRPRFGHQG